MTVGLELMERRQGGEAEGSPVRVFFYGSYMDFDVLAEVGLRPSAWDVACLPSWDIRVAPRANIVRADRHVVWGINVLATHAELERLYKEHALARLGELYLPQAVLVCGANGALLPAMTHVCPGMKPRPPDPAYVSTIVRAAERWSFPAWYTERIRKAAAEGETLGRLS